LRTNREWLDVASRTINRHWQVKNGTVPKTEADEPRGRRASRQEPQSTAMS
jgi:hypothetical protein